MIRFVLLIAVLLLMSSPAACQDHPGLIGSYPLPVAETEGFVESWLKQQGFSVHREPAEAGKAALQAKRGAETLTLEIDSLSPLASVVAVPGGGAPATIAALKAALQSYASGPTPPRPDKLSQDIPGQVLARQEAVWCLTTSGEGEPAQLTGFVVDPAGIVITTAHDLRTGETVLGRHGGAGELRGEVIQRDAARDLALVRMERRLSGALSPAKGRRQIKRGDRVYAIGCPENRGERVLSGVVQRPPAVSAGQPLWQVEMAILPGSSGSPAFDEEGRLVGVVKGRYRGAPKRGFVIPLDTLRDFLGQVSR